MDRIFNFVRSDLFLSLAGGFALGVAGLALVKPANADSGNVEAARSIVVGAPVHAQIASQK
ncbi:MAG: hypothetical protein IBJ12_15215 [Sphingomonadaceae bacterium]|nr:hypothetical protein [Sphingomonadaceae bacterium]